MGNHISSEESSDFIDHINKLGLSSTTVELKYWDELLRYSLCRPYRSAISPKLLHNIAKKNQKNVSQILTICVVYIESLKEKHNNKYIGSKFEIHLFTVLHIFCVFCIACGSDKELNNLFYNLISPKKSKPLATRFLNAICKILYCENITVENEDQHWGGKNNENITHMNSRIDLLDAFLIISNLGYYTNRDDLTINCDFEFFPSEKFVSSLCLLCNIYSSNISHNKEILEQTIRKMIIILSKAIIRDDSIYNVVSNINFKLVTKALFSHFCIFDISTSLIYEILTLLYIFLTSNPLLISYFSKNGYSIRLVNHILITLMLSYEKDSINYIHSVGIASLMLLLSDSETAKNIDKQFNFVISRKYDIQADNLADIIIQVCYHFFSPSLMESIVCLIHFITPYTSKFSKKSVECIFTFFDIVNKYPDQNKRILIMRVFIELFSLVLMNNAEKNAYFLFQIYKHYNIITEFCNTFNGNTLINFVEKLNSTLREKNIQTLNLESLIKLLPEINYKPIKIAVEFHPHVFSGTMKKNWNSWCDFLLSRCVSKENFSMNV